MVSDTTEIVRQEEELHASHAERGQLIASATAAKEASRLKLAHKTDLDRIQLTPLSLRTEFITTVSHELRVSGLWCMWWPAQGASH